MKSETANQMTLEMIDSNAGVYGEMSMNRVIFVNFVGSRFEFRVSDHLGP